MHVYNSARRTIIEHKHYFDPRVNFNGHCFISVFLTILNTQYAIYLFHLNTFQYEQIPFKSNINSYKIIINFM